MAPRSTQSPSRTVLRGRFGLWLLGIASAFALYLVVDALARGVVGETLALLPWLILPLWVIYLLLVRPALVVTDRRLVVVNVLFRHELDWGQVEDIQLRYQAKVVLRDGSTVTAWGAPAVGLDRTTGVAPAVGDPAAAQVTGIKRLVYPHIDDATPGTGTARRRWDLVGVVGSVVVIVLVGLTGL
ncbi:PH domain-containing protein [Luteimicrobium sp. DT211]|uniref:PH domain-containing protein n=1 Tax=Luteimicrobium sp. DT211 TaxID=3393412 RepID=UPI003CF1F0A2